VVPEPTAGIAGIGLGLILAMSTVKLAKKLRDILFILKAGIINAESGVLEVLLAAHIMKSAPSKIFFVYPIHKEDPFNASHKLQIKSHKLHKT
jgi:hypothetical protein